MVANHVSSEKRARQTIKKNKVNVMKRSRTKTLVKKLRTALEAKDKKTAATLFTEVQSSLAKIGRSSVTHKRTVGRLTSRLASQLHKI